MNNYYIFDTETDGHNPQGLIQLSVIGSDGKTRYNDYVPAMEPMNPRAVEVHGITDEKLVELTDDKSEKRAYDFIVDNLLGCESIFVAQNGAFDIRVINTFLSRCSERDFARPDEVESFSPRLVDTLPLSRQHIGKASENHKLDTLFTFLFPDRSEELFKRREKHDSLEDCRITDEVLLELGERYMDTTDIDQLYEEMGEAIKPKILDEWPFGKFKGERFEDTPKWYIKFAKEKMLDKPDILLTIKSKNL